MEFRCLVLFDYRQFDKICDRIKYLVSKRSGINHNFGKIRIGPDNSSLIEKMVTFHNLIILIRSVVNKNEDNYYYNIRILFE